MNARKITDDELKEILSEKFQKRFWSHVQKSGDDECWNWTGSTNQTGYGHKTFRRRNLQSHRAAWVMANKRDVPDGLDVLHTCLKNRRCCNPKHLYPGTARQNSADRDAQGHLVVPDNRGQKHSMSKLSDVDIPKIRELYATGNYFHKDIAKMFGVVSDETIRRIVVGKGWRHC